MTTTTPARQQQNGPPPNQSRALAPREELRNQLEKSRGQIQMALPRHLSADRVIRTALTLWNTSEGLQKCSLTSIIGGVIRASELGLELQPQLGQAYLVPYGKEAQMLVGYRGYIKLAMNTGLVSYFDAHEVHELDDFDFAYKPKYIRHKPFMSGDRGKVTCYYAAVRFRDGSEDFEVMTHAEVHAHMVKYSKGATRADSPWKTAFNEQAKKTVIRRLVKRVPMSPELAYLARAEGGTDVADLYRHLGLAPEGRLLSDLTADEAARGEAWLRQQALSPAKTAHDEKF